jgi:hypothetical protein
MTQGHQQNQVSSEYVSEYENRYMMDRGNFQPNAYN